jgi:hypothetical protein
LAVSRSPFSFSTGYVFSPMMPKGAINEDIRCDARFQ